MSKDNNNIRLILIIGIITIIGISLIVFGVIYSITNTENKDLGMSPREEQKEILENTKQEAKDASNGFIPNAKIENDSKDVKPYWEKERQPLTEARAEGMMTNAIRQIGKFEFAEAQKEIDRILSQFNPESSTIYKNNNNFFMDLVIMSNYDDLYGYDDENIIKQIGQCKDEYVILASTLRLSPDLYQYVVLSPDSVLPVIVDEVKLGKLKEISIEENEKEEVLDKLIRLVPLPDKITELEFSSDGIDYIAYFIHNNEVKLALIEEKIESGRLNTIGEWSEFFSSFESNIKEDVDGE